MRGELLISQFYSTPWAMLPSALRALEASMLQAIHGGGRLRADTESDDPARPASVFAARVQALGRASAGSSVQVLPCYGTIVQRAGMMTEWCGGTSTDQLASAISQAVSDPDISQILIDFDSPGGSVYGVQECGEVIRAAAAKKPVIGIANSMSASAAYWLLAQCSESYCTPGGEVGSIGVYTTHMDVSGQLEAEGKKVSLIQAGDYKTEGNPFAPLGDEARASIQASVDRYYAAFISAVAKGRACSVNDVRENMGKGRMLSPADAKNAGMIDGISTFNDLFSKMMRGKGSNSAASRAARAREIELLQ